MSVHTILDPLLADLFTIEELARFLTRLFERRGLARLAHELASHGSRAEAAHQAVGLLDRNRCLDPEFFQDLLAERPRRREDIQKAQWQVGRYAAPPYRQDYPRFPSDLPDRRRFLGASGPRQVLPTRTLQATAVVAGDKVQWTLRATGRRDAGVAVHEVPGVRLDAALQRMLADAASEPLPREKLLSTGRALSAFLLGGDAVRLPLMRALFDTDSHVEPSNDAVRLRLDLRTPALLALPWRLLAWGDRWLVEDGWTVEYGANPPDGALSLPNPFTILLLAPTHTDSRPRDGLGSQHLAATLHSRLGRTWGTAADRVIVHVRTWEAFQAELDLIRPSVVLVHADLDGSALLLDGPAGGVPVPLDRLINAVHGRIKLLWLGLHTDGEVQTCPSVATSQPCAVWPGAALWPADTAAAMVGWVEAIATQGLDPVLALLGVVPETPGLALLQAHGSADRWSVPAAQSPDRKDAALLFLDRRGAKGGAMAELSELVRHPLHRVLCLVGMGGPSDQVPRFHEQLARYLVCRQRELGMILEWKPLRLPLELSQVALEGRLRTALKGTNGSSLAERLESQRQIQKGAVDGVSVLWLDWGSIPPDELDASALLTAWIAFAHAVLGPACPDGLRIVHFLRRERPDADADAFADLAAAARELPHPGVRSPRVHQEALVPIGKVPIGELTSFLSDATLSTCPAGLVHEVAAAIIGKKRTGGRFDETVALLDRAEREDLWAELAREAKEISPPRARKI